MGLPVELRIPCVLYINGCVEFLLGRRSTVYQCLGVLAQQLPEEERAAPATKSRTEPHGHGPAQLGTGVLHTGPVLQTGTAEGSKL